MADCKRCGGTGAEKDAPDADPKTDLACARCDGDGIEPRDPEDGPSDFEIYNGFGMEGGIPYDR